MSGEWGLNDLRARIAQAQADIVAISAEIDGLGGGPTAWGGITGTLSAQADLQAALNGKQASGSYETAGAAVAAIAAHEVDLNPHTQYLTEAEADLLYIGIGLGGSDPWTWQKLALDNTVSTVAYANVTGMSFTALALTTYLVQVFGAYQTAATTTGIAIALDVPAGATIDGRIKVNTSATAMIGLEQIADATATGVSTGVRAANTRTPVEAWFLVKTGVVGGTVQLMQRSEIAASNTVLKAGLVMGRRAI